VGLLVATSAGAAEPVSLWTAEPGAAAGQAIYRLDVKGLREVLSKAPMEGTEAAAPVELTLPMPDGRFLRFAVEESPVMEPALAAQYPEIRTYAAKGLDDRATITRFSLTPAGFHALVLGPGLQAFVEPAEKGDTLRYTSLPEQRLDRGRSPCSGEDPAFAPPAQDATLISDVGVIEREGERRVYQLLAAATGEFTAAYGGTVDSALAAITTTINGVNAIYHRDLGIHFELLAASTTVIFTNGATDPYESGDRNCNTGDSPCVLPFDCLLTANQCVVDVQVGSANYDVSIVFDDSDGGRAAVGSVCDMNRKARGTASGTDVGHVAHELGHMFGARHSFNGTTEICGGNRVGDKAYEPGSGSTIMSYAGNCGAENVTAGKDLQFHHTSFLDMLVYSHFGNGDSCPGYANTGNYGPVVQGMTNGPYVIPKETPFALSVQAYDPQDDPITYSWEQNDLGAASPPTEDDGGRPIFRTYFPTSEPERWFPHRLTVLNHRNIPPDTYFCIGGPICWEGEELPTTDRTMLYNVMLRDGQDGVSVATYATVTSHAGSGPFKVTAPLDGAPTFWTQGARREVRWDVANTNQSPVTCTSVRITLSLDNGDTFPHVLAASTPNDGSELVYLPFQESTEARIKVEAVGNIFFDISDKFTIEELKVTNNNDSGRGSLRQAISDANDWPFGATIPLQIPGPNWTILVASPLPPILKPITLDGWDLGPPGYEGPPLLELDGSACVGCDGLTLQGNDAYVNGVIVNRFAQNGIVIEGARNIVQNSYIGTTGDGLNDAGNGASGVRIGGPDNILWGNVISGNFFGVTITGTTANANHLERNYIGTNRHGNTRIPNDDDGVRITNAPNTVIGGAAAADRNVIAGNGRFNAGNAFVETFADGIEIQGASATGTTIHGNYFGLNAQGTAGLDNTDVGVRVNGAPNTHVGSAVAGTRNVFADSSFINAFLAHGVAVLGVASTGTVIHGNYFGTDATGTVELGIRGAGVYSQSPGVQIRGNVIVNARNYAGIYLDAGASSTNIQGNYIGTDATGSVNLGVVVPGITAYAGNNTISGNVIAGTAVGIAIRENAASNNTIQGNLIGTNAAGTQDFGNVTGIELLRTGNNLIGGTTAGTRNVISGNDQFGIYIAGPPGPAGDNVVQGNFIGTNAAGTAAIANQTGVYVYETTNVTFGGAAAGAGNVVSGNQANGIELFISDPPIVVVQGNLVGTTAAGTAALPNGANGILAAVNGPVSILGNVISGNGQNGLNVCCKPTTAVIQGNRIGTGRDGALSLPNGWNGMDLSGFNNVVGGLLLGEPNVVAFNAPGNTNFAGIRVSQNGGHRIRGNAVFSNGGLGLDVGGLGVQGNDACDTDLGPNGLQNYPVLTGATQSSASTVVTGTMNSTASTIFDVDLYTSASCDPSGFGEGGVYVGSTAVTTDGACNGSFAVTIPAALTGALTGVAVDPAGNTSEFSACVPVQLSTVAEVGPLAWQGKTELSWPAAAGAAEYRVLRGGVADLANLLDSDPDSCERTLVAGTSTGPVLTEDPVAEPGRFYWYLVVGRNGALEGPAGSASAGPRVVNPSGVCP
jgi:hypothetical protein